MENNLITLFLKFHDTLRTLDKIRGESKQNIEKIADLIAQQKSVKDITEQLQCFQILYKYSAQMIRQEIVQRISTFEAEQLPKLVSTIEMLNKITSILLSYKLDLKWVQQNNIQFRLSLFQLSEILKNLSHQYNQQLSLVLRKWSVISRELIRVDTSRSQDVLQQLKLFILHISFQTCIQSELITAWDQIITSLQNKRYNN